MDKTKSVITGSLILTLIVGVLNSIYKTDKLPSFRFFFGTGILFLFLSGIAEFEEEVAKTLALAIATFVVLGQGGGVLDHFLGGGTSKTTLNTDPSSNNVRQLSGPINQNVQHSDIQRGTGGVPGTVGAPGLTPIKPAIPNGIVIHNLGN